MTDPENTIGATALSEIAHITALCPNCQTPLHGKFCAKCGQSQQGMDRFFLSLVAEAFDNIFSFDSRTARTLFALLFKPGFLTREYFAGRRARYIQPLRLYFIASLLFFLFLSVQNMLSEPLALEVIGDDAVTQGQPSDVEQDPTTSEQVTDKPTVSIQLDWPTDEQNQEPSEHLTSQQSKLKQAHAAIAEGTTDIHFEGLTDEQNQEPSEHLTSQQSKLKQAHAAIAEGTTDIHFEGLTDEQNQQISERLKNQLTKAATMGIEDPRSLIGIAIDIAPPVLLVLLPFFALALKMAYIGSRRYYTEHLILAVHNHCFVYLILLVENALKPVEALFGSNFLPIAMLCWMPLYMYLSLKKVYGQGYWLTGIKFLGLGAAYVVLFLTAFLTSLLAGILTL
jgi:hypothetical protein